VLMAGATPRIFMHVSLWPSGIPAGVPTDPPPNALVLATMDYSRRTPSISDLRVVTYEGQSLDASPDRRSRARAAAPSRPRETRGSSSRDVSQGMGRGHRPMTPHSAPNCAESRIRNPGISSQSSANAGADRRHRGRQ
jgi:hypothetical protein